MCEVCGPQIKEIKYLASLQDISVNNALILSNGFLQFGGALVKNTDVTGPYTLNLGTNASLLNQINIKASNKVSTEYISGAITIAITLDNNGILVTDTSISAKGLLGATDFKANYVNNSYVQKSYVDTFLLSKNITSILESPTVAQNGWSIIWDNSANKYTLAAVSFTTPALDTQVIFNDGGTLSGDNNFIFNKGGNGNLSVNQLTLGLSTYTGGDVLLTSNSTVANVDIRIAPKNNGNIILDTQVNGSVQIGATAGNFSIVRIQSRGNDSTISIALEPKGTEGIVYIGNLLEAGGYRYLQARGSATDITLQLRPKGAGEISIGNNSVNAVFHTLRAISASASTGLRLATKQSTYIDILNSGVFIGNNLSPTLYFGVPGDAVTSAGISVQSSNANVSLLIYAKGTGRVFINGWTFKEIPIGNWNMDLTTTAGQPHGLTKAKIKHVEVWVRNDADTESYPIDFVDILTGFVSGSVKIDATQVICSRAASGIFNTPAFSGTGFSRATAVVWYEI